MFSLLKKSSLCITLLKFWPAKTTIGNVWCKFDSRSNYHGTCKLLVFTIICKFLIFVIIKFDKMYLNQMCNVNNLSLIICATRTWMFSKFAISYKVLWICIKWWKTHETQFLVVRYLVCQILGIARSQIETKWFFSSIKIVTTLALGSWPKQGFAKVRAKRGSPGVTSHAPGNVGECEGMKTHTPKWASILGVGVLLDFQIFKKWLQGSKPIGLRSSLYHW